MSLGVCKTQLLCVTSFTYIVYPQCISPEEGHPLLKVLGKYYFLQLTGDRAWLPLSPSLRELHATQGGCEVSSQCRCLVLWEWSGASPRPPSGAPPSPFTRMHMFCCFVGLLLFVSHIGEPRCMQNTVVMCYELLNYLA